MTPTAAPPTAAPVEPAPSKPAKTRLLLAGVALGVIAVAGGAWYKMRPTGPGPGFVSGNGRVEATESDVASKLAGRVEAILVKEGDFVEAGQLLARMAVEGLVAQRDEARAQSRQAVNAVASAEAQVSARRSDSAAAQATVVPLRLV